MTANKILISLGLSLLSLGSSLGYASQKSCTGNVHRLSISGKGYVEVDWGKWKKVFICDLTGEDAGFTKMSSELCAHVYSSLALAKIAGNPVTLYFEKSCDQMVAYEVAHSFYHFSLE